MQEKIKSEGKCLFCGKTFAQSDIFKHLTTHFKEISKTGKQGKSFLVKVETAKRWGATPYFLSLWVNGDTTLKTIDTFLRDIWLDCCGHLSAFELPRKRTSKKFGTKDIHNSFLLDPDSEFPNEIAMSKKANIVFSKGLELEYTYDFGSSTELCVKVMDEYPVKADKKIVLLSRNEPLQIICSICRKAPASKICLFCTYKIEAEFCDQCAIKHAKGCESFNEEYALPVVNSPRMGVCGYEGGCIDRERDSIRQLKS